MGRIRLLGIVALGVVASAFVPAIAQADHFRGAYVTWKRASAASTTVEFQSIQLWRGSAVTPLAINPGDGDVTIIGPVSVVYTAIDLAGESYTVISYKAPTPTTPSEPSPRSSGSASRT